MDVTWSTHRGLAVYRFGQGDPILLMSGPHRFSRPGLATTDALINALMVTSRQVITFDPPGSGQSSRRAQLSMKEMHDCTDEALEVSGVSSGIDAVGHSMSGLALLAYAIDRPGRVRRLVLVGTGSGGPAYMSAPGALWNRSHPRFWRTVCLGVLHILWPGRAPERMLNNFIHRESFCDPSLAEVLSVTARDWFRSREGRTDWHRIARRLNYAPRLPEITVPALILCGRHDPQYPPACSAELAHGIKGARLVFFERSGHFPYIEEPDAFRSAVDDFLSHRR